MYTLGYMSDTSRYMYLAHFLGVTLDTYQDTSEYVYPRLVITNSRSIRIHRDTKSRYNTCILFECNRACKIRLRYIRIHQDIYRIHQDTYPDNTPPPNSITNPPAPACKCSPRRPALPSGARGGLAAARLRNNKVLV